ncbi:MAG: hypothetical protein HY774_28030 [Acidobacteria bacterium]|nr:hypothetical protein [Acidobacteriota bacterium]
MPNTIKESDWKIFSKLFPEALERLYQRYLKEIEAVAADDSKTYFDRFEEISTLTRDRRKEVNRGFDRFSRSRAVSQLAYIKALDLLTEEEFQRFSPETRELIRSYLGE